MIQILTIILLSLNGLSVIGPSEQTLEYHIVFHNKTVGEVKAVRTLDGATTSYTSYSLTTAKFIKTFTVLYEYDVKFKDGNLQSAESTILLNGKPHKRTEVKLDGDCYQVNQDGEATCTAKFPVKYSSVMLIFEEPSLQKKCFSEEDGTLHPLIPIGNHSYEKKHPKGRVNIYHYKNGILESAELDAGLITLKVVKK